MPLNPEYSRLLLANSDYHHKVREGRKSYDSVEWKKLQKDLLFYERELSSAEIIKHAAELFPKIGE